MFGWVNYHTTCEKNWFTIDIDCYCHLNGSQQADIVIAFTLGKIDNEITNQKIHINLYMMNQYIFGAMRQKERNMAICHQPEILSNCKRQQLSKFCIHRQKARFGFSTPRRQAIFIDYFAEGGELFSYSYSYSIGAQEIIIIIAGILDDAVGAFASAFLCEMRLEELLHGVRIPFGYGQCFLYLATGIQQFHNWI